MNQNTNKAETTRSKSARRNGNADNDTNTPKRFEATLALIQHSWAKVIIEAGSLAEAEEKAEEVQADDIEKWNSCQCSVEVHDLEPAEGARADD
jgi:hypothetical protein